MSKKCPSCGYGPIGPFTDNCPICAEPVRNVRSGGGGFGSASSWSPLAKGLLGAALVGVLVVGGCCGVGMWRVGTALKDAKAMMEQAQAEEEANRQARTVVVDATKLIEEFQANPEAADQKYQGKYLEVTGVVEKKGREKDFLTFVVLHGVDENAKVKIECFFDFSPLDDPRFKRLAKGQTITLAGEYEGQVSNIQLRECTLLREGK